VRIWDSNFEKCIRTYPVGNDYLAEKNLGRFVDNCPSVRAIFLGKYIVFFLSKSFRNEEDRKEFHKRGTKVDPRTVLCSFICQGIWTRRQNPVKYLAQGHDKRTCLLIFSLCL